MRLRLDQKIVSFLQRFATDLAVLLSVEPLDADFVIVDSDSEQQVENEPKGKKQTSISCLPPALLDTFP